MDLNLMSSEKYHLRKLSWFLNYELSSSLLLFFWYAWSFVFLATILAAAVFIPYMLFIFYKVRKIAWFILFGMVVVLPTVLCLMIGSNFDLLDAFAFIPLGLFYIYCGILRYLVNNRLNKINAREHLEANTLGERQMLQDAKERLE